jgi:hypothetical protein
MQHRTEICVPGRSTLVIIAPAEGTARASLPNPTTTTELRQRRDAMLDQIAARLEKGFCRGDWASGPNGEPVKYIKDATNLCLTAAILELADPEEPGVSCQSVVVAQAVCDALARALGGEPVRGDYEPNTIKCAGDLAEFNDNHEKAEVIALVQKAKTMELEPDAMLN